MSYLLAKAHHALVAYMVRYELSGRLLPFWVTKEQFSVIEKLDEWAVGRDLDANRCASEDAAANLGGRSDRVLLTAR